MKGTEHRAFRRKKEDHNEKTLANDLWFFHALDLCINLFKNPKIVSTVSKRNNNRNFVWKPVLFVGETWHYNGQRQKT